MAVRMVSSYGAASIHSVEHFVNERDASRRSVHDALPRSIRDVQKGRAFHPSRPGLCCQDGYHMSFSNSLLVWRTNPVVPCAPC
jgi:hypothetical protein